MDEILSFYYRGNSYTHGLDLLSYPETPYYILQSALSLPYLYLLLV